MYAEDTETNIPKDLSICSCIPWIQLLGMVPDLELCLGCTYYLVISTVGGKEVGLNKDTIKLPFLIAVFL